MLLSIAERAGAVQLSPGGSSGLLAIPTGAGSPRLAQAAIQSAKNRGWESYRSIERYMSGASQCRRRQILDHFGDPSPTAPSGRCCDVCDPDPALERALRATPVASSRRRSRSSSRSAGTGSGSGAQTPILARRTNGVGDEAGESHVDPDASVPTEPIDEEEFERLRKWRYARAEGKPAFTVAANTVLEEILRRRPADSEELLTIRGIGPAFCAKHGDSLLEELRELWDTPSGAATAIASVSAPT